MKEISIVKINNALDTKYGDANWIEFINSLFHILNQEVGEIKAKNIINKLAVNTLIDIAG